MDLGDGLDRVAKGGSGAAALEVLRTAAANARAEQDRLGEGTRRIAEDD